MGFINKGFPNIYFYDFPVDRWSKYSCTINTRFDSLPEDKEQLLSLLVKELLKVKAFWDSENIGDKRALRQLVKIAKSIEYVKGNGVMAFFVYTHSKKQKKISTSVIEDVSIPEFMTPPAGSDYNQDYINSPGKVTVDDKSYDLITEGVPCKTIFAVEHKNRSEEPVVQCNNCHGSGIVKCPVCKGSGREEYEDYNYVRYEYETKSRTCLECSGTGRTECPECNGRGEIDIFAAHYSLVHSVEEIVSKRAEVRYILPGKRPKVLISSPDELEHREYDNTIDGAIDRSYVSQIHEVVDLVNKTGELAYLKKNGKDYFEDRREEMKGALEGRGMVSEYEELLNLSERNISESIRLRGDIVSRKDALFRFPVIMLNVSYGESSRAMFVIYTMNGKTKVDLCNLYGMSIGEMIKYKIVSLLKK